jgi:hypothetical protein
MSWAEELLCRLVNRRFALLFTYEPRLRAAITHQPFGRYSCNGCGAYIDVTDGDGDKVPPTETAEPHHPDCLVGEILSYEPRMQNSITRVT